jgi:predicted XRE-type DNA-binding protein
MSRDSTDEHEDRRLLVSSPALAEQLVGMVEWATSHDDEVLQGAAVAWLTREMQATIAELSEARRRIVHDMHQRGYSLREIADMLGLSRSRILQIIEGKAEKVPGRYRPRCDWPNRDGEQCSRPCAFVTQDGRKVCGTHATVALETMRIEQWKP